MLGSIIGGIAGGIINNKGQRDANRTNQANHMREIANRDLHAKNRIQWMAKDAQAAGISPLAALGGGLPAFSPVAAPQQQNALRGMGQAVQNAGKSIQSPEARQQQANLLQNQHLQNKLLSTQIAGQQIDNGIRSNQMMQTKDPIPGQPDSAQGIVFETHGPGRYVDVNNVQVDANNPGRPAIEAGTHSKYTYMRNPDGSFNIAPSKVQKEKMEDDLFAQGEYHLQKMTKQPPPPLSYLPEGAEGFYFNNYNARWYPFGGKYGDPNPKFYNFGSVFSRSDLKKLQRKK